MLKIAINTFWLTNETRKLISWLKANTNKIERNCLSVNHLMMKRPIAAIQKTMPPNLSISGEYLGGILSDLIILGDIALGDF